MIDLFLGVAVALSGLLLALNLSKKGRAEEDKWLAGWLGLYCAMSLCFLVALHSTGVLGAVGVVMATSLIVLTGPFLFLYARAATGENHGATYIHFVPFGVKSFSLDNWA